MGRGSWGDRSSEKDEQDVFENWGYCGNCGYVG